MRLGRASRFDSGDLFMDNEQLVVPHKKLLMLSQNILVKAGVPDADAKIVAEILVHANLRGVDSHGVLRLPHYIKRIKAGSINASPDIKIEDTGPSTAMVDGDDGLGHLVARVAMEKAITLARQKGVGMVGAINSSHCGALSYYVQQAARASLIGLAMVNTDKAVAPYGGREAFFGTNPIAFGFPTANGEPVIIDMATSSIAYGQVINAAKKNNCLPDNCALDAQGNPTTNPHDYHVLLPFGAYKGYALAMVVDIFAGILTGSPFGPEVPKMYGNYEKKRKLGHYFTAIDMSRFTDREQFLANMDILIKAIGEVPPSKGFERVMVPGEPEATTEKTRRRQGIPILPEDYNYLTSG